MAILLNFGNMQTIYSTNITDYRLGVYNRS